MHDLLLDLFKRMYMKPVSGNSLLVTLQYVSIHPYNDFNERTCRFLDWIATLGCGEDIQILIYATYKRFFDVCFIPLKY